jgi:pantoate kinase
MFIPGHITGFFKICHNTNILKSGSIGAGITVNKGVYTHVVEGNGQILFNEDTLELCPTIETIYAIEDYLIQNHSSNLQHDYNILKNYSVTHTSDFPLSCGLGVSGCCALGTAYEFSKIVDIPDKKILEFAHISELKCGTGLGDVIAQYIKGFVIRKKPGLPVAVKKVPIENVDNYHVVVEILGKKDTNTIIRDTQWINKINKISDKLLQELLNKPSLDKFMELSYKFAKYTGLADENILELCNDLNFTLGASQAMLGNTLFCICKSDDLNDVLSILNKPIVCKIHQ